MDGLQNRLSYGCEYRMLAEKINHERQCTHNNSVHRLFGRVDKQQILIQCTAHHLHINWTVFRSAFNERPSIHIKLTEPTDSSRANILFLFLSSKFSKCVYFFNLPRLHTQNPLFSSMIIAIFHGFAWKIQITNEQIAYYIVWTSISMWNELSITEP